MANPVLLCTKNPSLKVSYTTKKIIIIIINKRKTYSLRLDQGVKEDTHSHYPPVVGLCLVSWLVGCVVLLFKHLNILKATRLLGRRR